MQPRDTYNDDCYLPIGVVEALCTLRNQQKSALSPAERPSVRFLSVFTLIPARLCLSRLRQEIRTSIIFAFTGVLALTHDAQAAGSNPAGPTNFHGQQLFTIGDEWRLRRDGLIRGDEYSAAAFAQIAQVFGDAEVEVIVPADCEDGVGPRRDT